MTKCVPPTRKGIWYHTSKYPLTVGDRLIPLRRESLEKDKESENKTRRVYANKMLFIEEIFEEVRRRRFPFRPSRLESVYVYDSLQDRANLEDYIYIIVNLSQINFKTDMLFYNAAIHKGGFNPQWYGSSKHILSEIRELAGEYWRGVEEYKHPEVLLLGEGIIKKEVKV